MIARLRLALARWLLAAHHWLPDTGYHVHRDRGSDKPKVPAFDGGQ